jgi:hypothetical protein
MRSRGRVRERGRRSPRFGSRSLRREQGGGSQPYIEQGKKRGKREEEQVSGLSPERGEKARKEKSERTYVFVTIKIPSLLPSCERIPPASLDLLVLDKVDRSHVAGDASTEDLDGHPHECRTEDLVGLGRWQSGEGALEAGGVDSFQEG